MNQFCQQTSDMQELKITMKSLVGVGWLVGW
jgi:hypothetical protein